MRPDELWWKRVPVAERAIRKAVDDLLAGRSIQIFTDMPWKETFVERIIDKFRDVDAGVACEVFDGAAMSPASSLIDSIAEQLGFGFNFDGKLETLIELMRLNSSCVWQMRALGPKHLREAQLMIRELARQKSHIQVILEDDTQAQIKSVFQQKLLPTRLDIQYFAWTLLMEREDVPMLGYAAILCEELSGGDPRRCAELCERIHELFDDPGGVCDWLSEEAVEQAVHLAQIRGIQPAIEEQRLRFIDRLGNRLERILPFSDEFDGQYTKPREVELRHLIYYRAKLSYSPAELALVNQLYSARNDLAHQKILTKETILALAALP